MVEGKLERLSKFVDRLPEVERERAIISVEGKLYSWKDVLVELKKGGDLAKKISEKLSEKLK